ncbi:zinc transporter, putative [Babesia microti strain RI]|uniref:Zinc transporter, putative n=1 Tax=Babesia microti (strain RI) TaxID=1133968 RepID=A0A1N6LXI7_BABMR|nr:zinc transporter, putative [Babesia microti strain RI]SIO73586.1 zinc transporter, putative [Babesia microti strain RI]|eukprot:XP_021337671.1 zinc transporter, putative [Babesia microti strain RI]
MSGYILLNKGIVATLCLLETIGFCYSPLLLSKYLNRIRNKYLNPNTINNATSGAILSLSLTHLMPEGFSNNNNTTILSNSLDITGFISMTPIVILISIDFLTKSPSTIDQQSSTLNKNSSISESQSAEKISSLSTNYGLENSAIIDLERFDVGKNIANRYLLLQLFKSRSFYMLLTLICHSILEGMLLGTKNGTALWAMTFGIVAHKWAECLIIINILDSRNKWAKNVLIVLFCLAVPLGIFVGHFISITSHSLEVIFGQLAAGFFIYLSFELLMENNDYISKNKLITWVSYMIGVLTMSVIMAIATIIEKKTEI